MKICSKCGEEKDVECFHLLKGKYRRGWCKPCHNLYQKENHKPSYNIRKHGITPEQYDVMLADQGGRCAICGTTEPGKGSRFAIDHDHSCCPGSFSCGSCVRGLLCNRCNMGIGLLQDNPKIIASALQYIIGG